MGLFYFREEERHRTSTTGLRPNREVYEGVGGI